MSRLPDIRFTPRTGLGFALLLVAAVALAWAGLGALAQARGRFAQAEAMARAGASPVRALLPDGQAYDGDRAAAERTLLVAIRAAAAERHLLLERAALLPADNPAELAVDISVSGPELDVLHFAHRLESGRPVVRFRPWRLTRTGPAETAVRLEARALAYRDAR